MRSKRAFAALLVLAAALLAGGCGGGGGGDEGGGTTQAKKDVSGNVTVVSLWTGTEDPSFKAVIAGFNKQYPNVKVTHRPVEDVRPVLSTAIEGGNPPDIAALPNPGLMRDFVKRNALKPIEFARSKVAANYSKSWLDLASANGKLYGVFFKGANKSTVFYNVPVFEDAGVEPPKDWDAFLKSAQTLKASGVPAYSIGASDGWVLTDLFENIYLRTAGPQKYDQLTDHKIPYTDPSVKAALTEMSKVISDTDNIAGGTSGALQTDFAMSVANAFQAEPKAAMVVEGDFVANTILGDTKAKPKTGFDVFDFPSVKGSPNVVVGGGDMIVMFKDNPAARALIEYLATPDAAEIWIKRGGFSSPNKSVDDSAYPDEILRTTASALAEAETFRFDLSDLAPSAFGGDDEFRILQDFMKKPKDVDATAKALEAAAAKAYK